ncbi:PA14 domain-containing protein [Paroceanicella profunda]|nr:PA14 domain-containing protein [Paroceanicella profunda]
MHKTAVFAGAIALFAAGTGAEAFEVAQYSGFVDGSLETIRAHMAAVAPAATVTTDRIDFSDYGDADGEFPETLPFPAAGGYTGNDGVNDTFVLRATGTFMTERPGRFVFKTRNDDAVFLLVDGQPVIADGNFHPPTENWGEIALRPGAHSIELYFVEVSGGGLIELSNERPEGGYDPVIEGGILAPKYPDAPAGAPAVAGADGGLPAAEPTSEQSPQEPVAATPEPAAQPEQTIGMWFQRFKVQGGLLTASFISSPEAALLSLSSGGAVNCHAVFAAAERFAQMREDGNDCNPAGTSFVIDGLDGEGRLAISGRVGDLDLTLPLPRLTGPEVTTSTMPARPLDLAGVTLAPRLGEMMARVSANFTPAGDPAPQSAIPKDPVASYEPHPTDPAWTTVSTSLAGPYLSFSTPDAEPDDLRVYPENEFLILSRDPSGFQPDSRPWGLVRIWIPVEADRVTAETLHAALERKYGPPSRTRTLGAGHGGRLAWSFDTAGGRLDAAASDRCSNKYPGGTDTGALHYAELGDLGGRLPDLEFPTRQGCGLQFVVGHPAYSRPTDTLAAVSFALYDPQDVLARRWSDELAGLAWQVQNARDSIATATAERVARDGKQPDL